MRLINTRTNSSNLLPLFAATTFGLHLLTLLVLSFHGSILQQLNRQAAPQLVQLVDGRVITVEPKDSLERNPETIRRFVGETMNLMFTWSQKQPPETVWQFSSELLSENFRYKFEKKITQANPDNPFYNNIQGTQTILVVKRISLPEPIKPGKWKVEIVAHRLIFRNSDNQGKSVNFNQKIFVQAVDAPKISLPNAPTPFHLATYRLGEAGLEIYNICKLDDKNCSEE